ncbi:uncharacterized protein METZ01_LOCUS440674, partial [marine metagenome]
ENKPITLLELPTSIASNTILTLLKLITYNVIFAK